MDRTWARNLQGFCGSRARPMQLGSQRGPNVVTKSSRPFLEPRQGDVEFLTREFQPGRKAGA
eukprot:5695906-Pyramimonas_sp.AAC.1